MLDYIYYSVVLVYSYRYIPYNSSATSTVLVVYIVLYDILAYIAY